uniref:Uncharacterized protein n=1 Tax=Ciona savignyi TaxID=51511 RepID=H2ZEG3_CIOSA
MLHTQSKLISTEMSHDYFKETFAALTPSKDDTSGKTSSITRVQTAGPTNTTHKASGEFHPAESKQKYKTSVRTKMCDHVIQNNNTSDATPCQYSHSIEEDGCANDDSPRRNSRIQNIASRLARKSFRMVSRRKMSEHSTGTPTYKESPSTKWRNSIFKRSRSIDQNEPVPQSYSSLADEDRFQDMTSRPTSLARDVTVVRSAHAPMTSSPRNDDFALPKRHSASCSLTSTEEDGQDGTTNDRVLNGILELKNYILGGNEQHMTSSELSHTSDKRSDLLENDVRHKYQTIRDNEEMRMVTIVTLLKRRRNSLKIKCDQFAKDVEGDDSDRTKAKAIRARLRHMRRKLNVVEQCIEEQRESMKVAAAKIELKCSLELFKLKLQRDSNSLCDVTPTRKMPYSSPTSPSGGFEAPDETVFDDASSTSTYSPKRDLNSSFDVTKSRCLRLASAPYCQQSPHYDVTECCDDDGRTRSIDYAVTSDCDSGFDNGDALSRSDVSLDRNLSKSTGSIASSASRSVRRPSALCDDIQSEMTGFMTSQSNSSSEQSLYGSRDSSSRRHRPRYRKQYKPDEVNSDVLASIAEFEQFAEKTKRRLHHNGKLVPLKKGT